MGIGNIDDKIKHWIETETPYAYIKEDLLWLCATEGKIDFVKYLLNKGYDLHYENDYALSVASRNGHIEVVKVLLAAGANMHADDARALRYARRNGHTEVVELLQDHIKKQRGIVKESITHFKEDSDPIDDMNIGNMDNLINQWAATIHSFTNPLNNLWLSAKYGKLEYVKYLLNKGYDVHALDDLALRMASLWGQTEIVKVLLDAGANVHADNDLALINAAQYNYPEIVKLLLDAGANVHAQNNAALRKARNEEHTEVVKILQDHINKKNKNI